MIELSTLNPGQLEAVLAPLDSPVLVIAGAGTGKTRTAMARAEHIVMEGGSPNNVVALTFTRKAAAEFAKRLEGGPASGIWSGTLHSFAYHRLKQYREACGDAPLEVLPYPKQHIRKLIGRPSRSEAEQYREAVTDAPELDLSSVIALIDAWQNELMDPQAARESAEDWIEQWSARIYDAYTRWKRRHNLVDFGDMLGLAVEAYEADPLFLRGDRERFRWAIVDELQDTNTAQWRLCHLLWSRQPIFGVGDARQAIYTWRGARPEQFMAFRRLWPDVRTVRLDENYRSTPQIVHTAETLIIRTPEAQMSGRLKPNRPDGPTPQLVEVDSHADEAQLVAETIEEWLHWDRQQQAPMELGRNPGDIAVLYRTNAQSVDFEDTLAACEIPYQVVGSKGFWGRREIRQLLAYLRLAVDPSDREAFALALGAPSRFLGGAFIQAAGTVASDHGFSLVEACAHVTGYSGRSLNRGQADAASDFTTLIQSLGSMTPNEALDHVLKVTEFRRWLARQEGTTEGADDDRDDAISKLVEYARLHETHQSLLTHAEKQASKASSGSKPDPNRVQLMTIHRAKGLEWPLVFVAGFSEGLLPHAKGDPNEERRLAYVAMTRPQDRLILIAPQSTYKGPSSTSEFAIDAGLITPVQAATGARA